MPKTQTLSLLQRWSRLKRGVPVEPSGDAVGQDKLTPLPDPATLDARSDFSRFLEHDVPAELRARALRALWRADPALSACDGLIDYAGDYTDAATVPCSPVATAFRLGQGLLSDEEARAWLALGLANSDEMKSEAVAEESDCSEQQPET